MVSKHNFENIWRKLHLLLLQEQEIVPWLTLEKGVKVTWTYSVQYSACIFTIVLV